MIFAVWRVQHVQSPRLLKIIGTKFMKTGFLLSFLRKLGIFLPLEGVQWSLRAILANKGFFFQNRILNFEFLGNGTVLFWSLNDGT